MTFSIVARCPRTAALGICLATSSPAVSSRCPYLRGGVAAISSQCHTQPRHGVAGLALAEAGLAPEAILAMLRASDPHFAYRQIGIVDAAGRVAVHSGERGKDYTGHLTGEGFVVMGNLLAGAQVVQAMHDAWHAAAAEEFEERLVRVVEAGYGAGGEPTGQLSAGLMVAMPHRRPRTRLQIDMVNPPPEHGGDAVLELRRVFNAYRPFIEFYDEFWPAHPELDRDAYLKDRGA